MVLPLDVRHGFILEDAARAAEGFLNRPVEMLFHCPQGGEHALDVLQDRLDSRAAPSQRTGDAVRDALDEHEAVGVI